MKYLLIQQNNTVCFNVNFANYHCRFLMLRAVFLKLSGMPLH